MPVDLIVGFGDTPAPPSAIAAPPYRSADNWLELTVPNICTFSLIAGWKLVITHAAGSNDADTAAMLVASGLPMALWSRGGLLLHASAVLSPDSGTAIAIAGPSGAGKSLVLHRLVHDGMLSLADDSLWLRATQAGFSGSGLPGGGYVGSSADRSRQFVGFDAEQCRDAAPLGAVVFLTAPADSSSLRPLHGQAAMAAVLRQRHRPTAARLLGREASAFELAALLCRQVPMYALSFDPGDPEPALAALQALFARGAPMTAKV